MAGTVSLSGVFDMHVHTAPDIRERAYTDFDLMEAAVRVGAKGIVIKSHHGTTVERAFLVNLHNRKLYGDGNDFVMYGGIVLNNGVGGINPKALETELKMGAKVVWLPTHESVNHFEKMKIDRQGVPVVDADGRVLPSVLDVLRLVKDYDVALATGHLSPREIFPVVEEAKKLGIAKIIVTHPEFWVVGMTVDEQARLIRDYDVILERCYAQPIGGGNYKKNLEDNLALIRTVGHGNIMVNTDGGQVENPPWEVSLQEYMQYLFDNGITGEQLDHMTKKLPAWLLGIGER